MPIADEADERVALRDVAPARVSTNLPESGHLSLPESVIRARIVPLAPWLLMADRSHPNQPIVVVQTTS